jgi:uncharacterized protein YaiE (UPF0345 family)
VEDSAIENESSEKFKLALLAEDDIGRVIRTHIYIELLLNEFLEFALIKPRNLKNLELDYFGKVNLAICLGLSEDLMKPLLQIGKIRNLFAHKFEQTIDKSKMNNFYSSFTTDQKTEIMEIVAKSKLSWVKNSQQWRKTSPSNQFMILAMSLFYMMKIEVDKYYHSTDIKKCCENLGKLYAEKHEYGL